MFGESPQEEIPQISGRIKTPKREEYIREDELCLSKVVCFYFY